MNSVRLASKLLNYMNEQLHYHVKYNRHKGERRGGGQQCFPGASEKKFARKVETEQSAVYSNEEEDDISEETNDFRCAFKVY